MKKVAKITSSILSGAAVLFAAVITKVMLGEMETPSELTKK